MKTCKSPKQLIEYLGKTPFILKPSIIRNDDEVENNVNLFGKFTPLYMYLPIFVMNRIPSDDYRFRNPMLKIKKNKKTGIKYIEPNASLTTPPGVTKQESADSPTDLLDHPASPFFDEEPAKNLLNLNGIDYNSDNDF